MFTRHRSPTPTVATGNFWRNLGTVLDATCEPLDHRLVTPAARARLAALAQLLPGEISRHIYLETRLTDTLDQVDLIMRVDRAGAEILAGCNPVIALPASIADDAVWRRLAGLCREWLTFGSPIARSVADLWLEFDIAAAGSVSAPPLPSLFVGLRPAVGGHPALGFALGILRELSAILDVELHPRTTRLLSAMVSRLPPGVTIPYLGIMLGRHDPAWRVYLANLATRDWVRLLTDFVWPGDTRGLARTLDTLSSISSQPSLPSRITLGHFDIEDQLGPRCGFEYRLNRREQLRGAIAEQSLLNRSASLGLISERKVAALKLWPGVSRKTLPGELWPSVVARRVNCLKLVADGRSPTQMKAYLLMDSQFIEEARPASGRSPSNDAGARPLQRDTHL